MAVSDLCIINRVGFADFVQSFLSTIGTVILKEAMADIRSLYIPVNDILSRGFLERWRERGEERGEEGREG